MDTMTAAELAAKLADRSQFTHGELARIARTFGVEPAALYSAVVA